MVTYKAHPQWSGTYLNGFPNSPTATPMRISQHTKPGSFCRSSSSGRMPTLLIYSKTHNFQMGLYLLSSIVLPFRQNHLQRQTMIRRVLDGRVQSKSRREGILFLVSSCSDRIGSFHLHFMSPSRVRGQGQWTEVLLSLPLVGAVLTFYVIGPTPYAPLADWLPSALIPPCSHMGLSDFPL